MQHLQPNTTLQGGKYRIERVLGQGGFGITYLAVQTSLNRYVAIKELFIGGEGQAINDRRGNQVVVTNSANQQSFNQQREKFKKEAMRLANLNHPNLVKVHDFFEENDTVYYVMEYIDGESLRTKLNRDGCLSEKLVLKYMQQLFPALEVAHRQSVWHLDIKPENIMVDKFDHIYLIDFGASKHIEHNRALTTSLALAYTRGYCPPELAELTYGNQNDFIQALKDIGPWTDIYSLGATMYNLLTDSIPPSPNRLYKDGYNAFIFPNNIETSTHDLIVWMMKPNMEDRPQNVNEIIVFLKENALFESNEYTSVMTSQKDQTHPKPNFIILDKKKSNKPEKKLYDTNNELPLFFETSNIIIDYDIVDVNLFDNLCQIFNNQLQSKERIYIEEIAEKTKTSIGIIFINLGWLMKEGKVDDSWNIYVKRTMTQISIDLAGFSAGDVYQALAKTSFPLPLEDLIEEVFKLPPTSIEGILLGLGWLMKEGKLHIENNLISLGEDTDNFNEVDNTSIKSISSEETIISSNFTLYEDKTWEASYYNQALNGDVVALHVLADSAQKGNAKAIEKITELANIKFRYVNETDNISVNLRDSLYYKAENGDANAQYFIGLRYLHGVDEKKNKSEAIKWFSMSAKQGEMRALKKIVKLLEECCKPKVADAL